MKASRKLIPAFAMLLIAAVMMSTASYAWFVTNGTVEANGMSITAKANTTYLMISSTSTGFEDDDISKGTVETVNVSGIKYPVVYDGSGWKKAVGTTFSDGTKKGEYSTVTDTGEYVVKQEFFVKVAAGYDNASNFKLTSIQVTGASQAVSVMVEAGSNVNYTKVENAGVHEVVGDNLYDTITTSAVSFTVYIYINGDHPDVTNQKFLANTLKDLAVSLTFDATAGT